MSIFDVRGTTEAAYVNLKRLAIGLQSWPEDIYTWANFLSRKYGVSAGGQGTKVQVNRLRHATVVTDSDLAGFNVAQTRNAVGTTSSDLQVPSYDSVDIEVQERGDPKPFAIKKQALIMAQQNVLQHTMIMMQERRNDYINKMARKTIRDAVCSTVYGANRASLATVTDTSADNLSLTIMKELRRRLKVLQVRPFGGYPNADGQFLSGRFPAIIDVNGENQLTNDDLWQTFSRYELNDRGKYTTGYVGDAFGFTFYCTDTGATSTAGASGQITCSEVIVMGQDPTLVEGGNQGMVGEFPCVYAQVGPVEVVKAKEDNFERDWISNWFAYEGWAALEALSSGDATALTTILGGGGTKGTAVTGSSRFIHKALHSTTM